MMFRRCGMTMRTPAGAVDLVPLLRRLAGDETSRIAEHERPAAALALTHLGVTIDQVSRALNTSHGRVRDALAKYGMDPVPAAEPFSWTGLAYTSRRKDR